MIAIAALVSVSLLSACASSQYEDGVYAAEMPEFEESGWKEVMEVTIEGGEITKVDWDAIYKDESIPIRKKQYSKSGLYGMLQGPAQEEWYDQAVAAEQFVLENGVDALNLTADGHTDAVSGCTISVSAFEQLLRECLQQAEK
jgi:major membrane immunogen (membrane-anchored lipoprotein)